MSVRYLLPTLLLLFNTIYFSNAQCPRQTVIDNYNNKYLTANFTETELNWTGDVSNCTPGTMSEAVRAKHLQKINYYRELVGGLTTDITFDDVKNQQALATVLMFEAENTPQPPIAEFSHCLGPNGAPCDTYACTSPEGITAAQNGNIAFSFPNWDAQGPIDIYMREEGDFNEQVIHRRWLLYSGATDMGIATSTRFNAMSVIDAAPAAPTYQDFIAYPPKGYMPQTLVPQRWSFGIPNADFSAATVSMTDPNGTVIPVIINDQTPAFYGDNSIVWTPANLIVDSEMDLTYTVTIANITGAAQSTYTYETTIVPLNYPPLCPLNQVWKEEDCACGVAILCPEGDLEFKTQTDIDNFVQTYPNCTQITGSLVINGGQNPRITDLSGLAQLTNITGALQISRTNITDLSGLQNLETVDSNLFISSNNNLVLLNGFDALISVGGILDVSGNASLLTLDGFNQLQSVGKNMNISINDALTSITGFQNLQTVPGDIFMIYNTNLTTITGFNKLTTVGFLAIEGNSSLTSLEGLSAISNLNNLFLFDNASLTACSIANICDHLSTNPITTYQISNNAIGCNTPAEVIGACNITTCPPAALGLAKSGFVQCVDRTQMFTINTIPDSIIWDYGDGTIETNPSDARHSYSATGEYTVKVWADYGNNCLDSAAITISIGSSVTDFTYSSEGRTIIVEADSINAAYINRYTWEMGDGSVYAGLSTVINHTYASPGEYEIVLSTSSRCASTPVTKTITLTPICNDLELEAVEDRSTCFQKVKGIITGGTAPYQFSGSNEANDIGFLTDCAQVTRTGWHTVNVRDAEGCTATDSIFIDSLYRVIDYTIVGDSIQFEIYGASLISLESTDIPGGFNLENLRIPLPTTGIYSACFNLDCNSVIDQFCRYNIVIDNEPVLVPETTIATCTDSLDNDNNGLIDSADPSCICVLTPAVEAGFSYTITEDSILFTDLSTGENLDKQWTFNTPTSIQDNRTPLPPAGDYEICLIVNNECEDTSTICQTITIVEPTICTDTPLAFSPYPGQTTPDGSIYQCSRLPIFFDSNINDRAVQLTWDYGNGLISTGTNYPPPGQGGQASTVYDAGGTYNVRLKAIYPDGCVDSTNFEMIVIDAMPTFTYEVEADGLTYHFQVDTAYSVAQDYLWEFSVNFGFPITKFGESITYTFPETGNYGLRLDHINGACLSAINFSTIEVVATVAETTAGLCSDGLDNDKDGLIDCEDSDCPCIGCPTDLVLSSQAEVNNFINNYPGCSEVLGNLTIEGASISDLSGISNITKISGDLTIKNNSNLRSLSGLHLVDTLLGSFILEDNPVLTDLYSLDFKQLGGDFKIGINRSLANLFHPTRIRDLDSIGGNFQIWGTTSLVNLDFLKTIKVINGFLTIRNQTKLVSLEGLNDLTTINGGIFLWNNRELASLTALSNVTTIDGTIDITNNGQLTSLSGLDNIDVTTISELILLTSSQLSFCSVKSICDYVATNNSATIAANATGCESLTELQIICGGTVNPLIFDEYPWLVSKVNPNNCSGGERITEYTTFFNQLFFFVETANSAVLYNENGQVWCTNGLNYDCTQFYAPHRTLRSWTCGDAAPVDDDMDGVFSDADPDDENPCIPNNKADACGNQPIAPYFLDDYPWLADRVNFDNCLNETITIYQAGTYEYLFIQNSSDSQLGTLYNAAGQTYCFHSPTYDCLTAYNLNTIKETWTCGDQPPAVDNDQDGILSNIDVDDTNPCLPDSTNAICAALPTGGGETPNTGTASPPTFLADYDWLNEQIDFDNCTTDKITVYRSGGYIYLLVETPQTAIVYNAKGQLYCTNSRNYNCLDFYKVDEEIDVWTCGDTGPTPVDEDEDGSFSDVDPDDTNPCVPDNSVANCDSTMPTEGGSAPPDFLEDYPWIADQIDFETCTTDKITVYQSGGYTYLLIETPESTVLYNAKGQLYCTSSPTYDCQAFYRVDETLAIWTCGESEPAPIPVDGDGDGLTDDVDPDDMDACNPDPDVSACLLISGTLPPFFEQYPWLADVVNPFDCGAAKVTVYKSGNYDYLFVEADGFPVLYNATGLRYCSNSSNYDCQEFYTVDEVVEIWNCGDSFQAELPVSRLSNNELPVAVEEVQLFPNPTMGRFTVALEEVVDLATIRVLTVQGQVIRTVVVEEGSRFELDVSGEMGGVYFVEVASERGVFLGRLVLR